MNELFHLGLDPWQMIDISQRSNHQFLEIKGGFMDQFAYINGRRNHAIFLDCKSREADFIPMHFAEHVFDVINSMITHDHATSAFNQRVEACRRVVLAVNKKYTGVQSLREINDSMLTDPELHLDPKDAQKGQFVIEENHRVEQFVQAIKVRDIDQFGALLTLSHIGLKKNMKSVVKRLTYW